MGIFQGPPSLSFWVDQHIFFHENMFFNYILIVLVRVDTLSKRTYVINCIGHLKINRLQKLHIVYQILNPFDIREKVKIGKDDKSAKSWAGNAAKNFLKNYDSEILHYHMCSISETGMCLLYIYKGVSYGSHVRTKFDQIFRRLSPRVSYTLCSTVSGGLHQLQSVFILVTCSNGHTRHTYHINNKWSVLPCVCVCKCSTHVWVCTGM